MSTKEIVTYAGTVLLCMGAGVLVQQHIISWVEFTAFAGALLFPSAGHVAIQRAMKDGDK